MPFGGCDEVRIRYMPAMCFAVRMICIYRCSVERVKRVAPNDIWVAVSEFPDIPACTDYFYIRRVPILNMANVLLCRFFHRWFEMQGHIVVIVIAWEFGATMIAFVSVFVDGRNVLNPMLFPMAARGRRRCRYWGRLIGATIHMSIYLIPGCEIKPCITIRTRPSWGRRFFRRLSRCCSRLRLRRRGWLRRSRMFGRWLWSTRWLL